MVFFALLCYNDLSKNRKVDAKMDYQKWAQEIAQKIKIKELEVAKRNRGKIFCGFGCRTYAIIQTE